MPSKLLLVGFNTRALAESSARAGIPFVSVDCFGDLDHTLLGPVFSPRHPQQEVPGGNSVTLESLVKWGTLLARRDGCDAIVCAAGFENRPELLQKLSDESGCRVCGNPPSVLADVRDPVGLSAELLHAGFRSPETRPAEGDQIDWRRRWLVKPRKSGGGHGIVPALHGRKVPAGSVYQEYVEGTPCSFSFVSDGLRSAVLGVTEQLAVERSFTGRDFGYAGNVFPLVSQQPQELLEKVRRLAQWLTTRYGLRGLNGVDFVLREGDCWVLEVNPRYSASMELMEGAYGISMIELHRIACDGGWQDVRRAVGRLPVDAMALSPKRFWGKRVIYTRERRRVRSLESEMVDEKKWALRMHGRGLRDLPFPGELIPARRPVATAVASGLSRTACMKELDRLTALMNGHLSPAS